MCVQPCVCRCTKLVCISTSWLMHSKFHAFCMAFWESRVGLQQQDDSQAGGGFWPMTLVTRMSKTGLTVCREALMSTTLRLITVIDILSCTYAAVYLFAVTLSRALQWTCALMPEHARVGLFLCFSFWQTNVCGVKFFSGTMKINTRGN